MLIYVCCLFIVLCHRRVCWLIFLLVKIYRYIIYIGLRLGEGREFIQLCLSATPFEGRRRHIGDFGNKVWYYPPTGVGMYLN